MAGALVQALAGLNTGTITTCSLTNGPNGAGGGPNISTTAGNHLEIIVLYVNAATRTFTFPTDWGTTQTVSAAYHDGVDTGIQRVYAQNIPAASANALVTASGTVSAIGLYVKERSGLAFTNSLLAGGTVNRQVSPGTGSGAITASVTPGTQPAWLDAFSWARNLSTWDTTPNSDTIETGVWNASGYGQNARVTSAASRNITWTTTTNDTFFSWIDAWAEAPALLIPPTTRFNPALLQF